ncbi:MAG: hypothetical protein HN392_06185 [Anaerolineae bacterium]|jgi:hypothetical protein|nr:hypothetical protein [Anaerolineae bacterium]MBT7075363.1 hypothetical protein [Anaerolineae bacterium]MBT7602545.1 hypothetical protein [Anaerolineae bacterium]
MNPANNNPNITPFLRYFTLVEAFVLVVVGFGLFLFPAIFRPLWPWEIAPFNTRFLGAIYLGAMFPIGFMYLSGRWSPTRPVLRSIFTFTFVVLLVSLFTINLFDFKSWAAWAWFILYFSLPASAGYHLWLYRSMPSNHLHPVPYNWQMILKSTSFLLTIYGLGLIFLPSIFSSLFPWKLDVFHSQLYSATFITGGVMIFSVASRATPAEFIAAGLTEATFSIFAILGLIIVDIDVQKISWLAPNTITWLGILVILAVLGLTMIAAGSRQIPRQSDF